MGISIVLALLLSAPETEIEIACQDTLTLPNDQVETADAVECLKGFAWQPREFTATVRAPTSADYDAAVTFPSPHAGPAGVVYLEWRKARESDVPCRDARPAVIIVHESGRGMTAGRTIARALCRTGVHTFLVQLPGYGQRRVERRDQDGQLVEGIRQGVADTRRAADAARRMEGVTGEHVSVLGVSLGGFVATLAGSLDNGFDQHFILMAGADLPLMFRDGQREVAELRRKAEAVRSGTDLLEYLNQVEPARVAHRLQADRTFLYTAMFDVVVPTACSDRLAECASLPPEHVIRMPCGHHSAVAFLLPMVVDVSARVSAR